MVRASRAEPGVRAGGAGSEDLRQRDAAAATSSRDIDRPPGTEGPRGRWLPPKIRWEIAGCAVHGHDLVDSQTAARSAHASLLLLADGEVTWHRCLRCDSWLPLDRSQGPPTRAGEVTLPLRGRPLRDRYVLRIVAVDRMIHVLVLAVVLVALVGFADHRAQLHGDYVRVLDGFQSSSGGITSYPTHHGLLHSIDELFAVSPAKLHWYGTAIAAYATVNALEAIGLWGARRWAEYLTLVEVLVLLPPTALELANGVSAIKLVGLMLDLLLAVYLLWTKRLFGVRGGGAVHRAERATDSGWTALERVTPHRC